MVKKDYVSSQVTWLQRKKMVRMILNNAFTKTHGDLKNGDWKLSLLTSYDT